MVDDGNEVSNLTPVGKWIAATNSHCLPKVVVVAGSAERSVNPQSVQWRKTRRKQMETRGYQAVEWQANAMDFGAALDQEQVFDVYYQSPTPCTKPP